MDIIFWVIIIGLILWGIYKAQSVKKAGKNSNDFSGKSNKESSTSLSKSIGETEAICPYCNKELDKKPSRKTKCPHCENYIYKRSRPYDNANILIREDQIEDIKEQEAIKDGSYGYYLKEKKRRKKIRDRLKKQYGNEPTDEDVEFRALNEQATEYEQANDWGFARNMRLGMAKNLEKREKSKLALRTYFHVCFLDLNRPQNRGNFSAQELAKYPPFDRSTGFLAPGVIKRMGKILNQLDYNSELAKDEFLEVTLPIHQGTPTKVDPNNAWSQLEGELFKQN